MEVTESALPGVLVIEPTVHRDARGFFAERWHAEQYAEAGLPTTFVQDNHSRSVRATLRGLHWQERRPQGKLVWVVVGAVFDVAVDVRPRSPTFGRWFAVALSAENFRQCYVPPGFAHGFCVLSDVAEVAYKCTDYYDPGGERGLLWNDPEVGIEWPLTDPILSDRDRRHPTLRALFGHGPHAHAVPRGSAGVV